MSDVLADFTVGALLLFLGGLITNFTINRYQKKKEHNEIREKLVQTHSEVFKNLFRVRRTWNVWIEELIANMDSNLTLDDVEIPPYDEFEMAFHEFFVILKVLTGKMSVFLKSTPKLSINMETLNSQVAELS